MVPGGFGFDDQTTALTPAFDPTPDSGVFLITVSEGPDAGAELTIDGSQPSTLIGQGPACGLRLSDRSVSRRHLRLEVCGQRLRVSDLGSRNGTTLDGVQIVEAYLHERGTICVGKTVLQLQPGREPGRGRLSVRSSFGEVLGASTEMRRLYPLCERLAASDVPVLIEGETGTGKEVLAEALHSEGRRADGPFVVFDCTAVPPSMMEAALFGHERGSFTGAVRAHRGVFERAHGGVLLIDEIGDLDLRLQPKLLRAVEKGEVQRLGGEKLLRVDVRILAATRRNLDNEVQAGRFRDDLFHRLAVARIELPPLRERKGDLVPLVKHFMSELGGSEQPVPHQLLRKWQDADWPGNVRELRNAVMRYIALGDLDMLGVVDEPSPSASPADVDVAPNGDWLDQVLDAELPLVDSRKRVVAAFERRYIERVLKAHDGNVARAAEAAGVAKRYFQLIKSRVAKT